MYMEQEVVLEFSKFHCRFQISIFTPLSKSPPLYLMPFCCTIFFFLTRPYQIPSPILAHILCILSANTNLVDFIIHVNNTFNNLLSKFLELLKSNGIFPPSQFIYFCGNFGLCHHLCLSQL